MKQSILSKEDVLCMQYAGTTASQLLHPQLETDEYASAFETYRDKAEEIMAMQQERSQGLFCRFIPKIFKYKCRE